MASWATGKPHARGIRVAQAPVAQAPAGTVEVAGMVAGPGAAAATRVAVTCITEGPAGW